MENENKPTWITDNFPLDKLECQYYDICKTYVSGKCGYSDKCHGFLILQDDKKLVVRDVLRKCLESYVTVDTLGTEIDLIKREGKS